MINFESSEAKKLQHLQYLAAHPYDLMRSLWRSTEIHPGSIKFTLIPCGPNSLA